MLCLAGAGSGKTRVLTERIASLIHRGVAPGHILTVTFARKAAGEIRTRLESLVPPDQASLVHMGTFHSIGLTILKEFGALAQLPERPLLTPQDNMQRRVSRILEAHESPLLEHDGSRAIGEAITSVKLMLPLHLDPDAGLEAYRSPPPELMRQLWEAGTYSVQPPAALLPIFSAYQEEMADEGLLDFQDLLSIPTLLLNGRPGVRDRLRDRWR